ncbi:MAG: rRNA pseudouridine synthase [Xanthomonadales bacterium]|nr:rRNA pseudouridine synthase [Xanthomonadales bacterium]
MQKRPTPPYGGKHRGAAGKAAPRFGVARVLSKQGVCSRSEAERWVRAGRVRVNGQQVLDPEHPVRRGVDMVAVDGREAEAVERIVIALNKPRGLVTTTRDEQGRDTVYRCLDGSGLPWLAPVGRLDKASEGLLLFSNDPVWAAAVLDPARGPGKRYHVQIEGQVDAAQRARMLEGIEADGERLAARQVRPLRGGARHQWLEIELDEGRNRQIRRMLEALDVPVKRLVRVAIGNLELGDLSKGAWRQLAADEVSALLEIGHAGRQ